MPFAQNQLFGMEMFDDGFVQGASFAQGANFAQGGNQVVGQQQYQQGQVNNYVNYTSSVGNSQAVENVNYYDTYHHRVNNYHTMNTNRYRDHYIDHNVYYNNRRNVYDGADYHTTSSYVVEQPTYAASGATAGANAGANAGTISGTISGTFSGTISGTTSGTAGNSGCNPRPCYGCNPRPCSGYNPRPCYQQVQPFQTSTVATQGTGRVFPGCGCRRNVL